VEFKDRVDEATDWSHERGIPIRIDRDKHGYWFIEAQLEDAHGSFRAVVSIVPSIHVAQQLDKAVSDIRYERRKAFHGKTPGHLPTGARS